MRQEILERMNIRCLEASKRRVLIDSDVANEADDDFAIIHQLLSPSLIVEGIIASHFEEKCPTGDTMEKSYKKAKNLLKYAQMEDIALYKGESLPIGKTSDVSEGVLKIIGEAKKPERLYITCQGALTNIARAIMIDPSIQSNITVIVNGGSKFRPEFNIIQDIEAAKIVFKSELDIWQIPQEVYSGLETTLAELRFEMGNSAVSKYLYGQLENMYEEEFNPFFRLRNGENWTLGDNAVIGALLMNPYRGYSMVENAPIIGDMGEYIGYNENKKILVFKNMDYRMVLEDMFSKIRLAYGD